MVSLHLLSNVRHSPHFRFTPCPSATLAEVPLGCLFPFIIREPNVGGLEQVPVKEGVATFLRGYLEGKQVAEIAHELE